jgi:hypothetical protein
LNSPLEESLINFLRSGPHLLNETTGKPAANEAPIWNHESVASQLRKRQVDRGWMNVKRCDGALTGAWMRTVAVIMGVVALPPKRRIRRVEE